MTTLLLLAALLALVCLFKCNAIDTAVPLATRFNVPADAAPPGSPPLEFVHWPLYSAVAFDAAAIPRETQAFGYTRGGQVAGAGAGAIGNATIMHTNMEVPSAVPGPRIFLVHGIRLIANPLSIGATPALSDASVGTTANRLDQVDDLTLLYQALAIEFSIGLKVYAQGPAWMFPANVGIGGLAAIGVEADPDGASAVMASRVAVHTAGRGWSHHAGKKPALWNTQPFKFRLLCDWTTNPTLVDTRLLYAVLDGVYGREIQ